jgi:hypothetical protein
VGDQLRVLLAEEGADAERLDRLTGFLRAELLQRDVEDVTALRTEQPPPGARAFDAVAIGGLVVSLGQTGEGLRSVVSAIRRWLAHDEGIRRAVRLELDGDVLELAAATASDQDRLIDVFIGRHAAGGG